MNLFALTLALVVLGTDGPGDYERTLTVGDAERRYLVHVPPNEPATDKRYPVVLIFHGGGGNAEQVMHHLSFNGMADEKGFLAVYPEGTGRLDRLKTWNSGGGCCGYAARQDVDDVDFVRAVLDDLESRYPVDVDRVFATGMSNGAMLCHRLGNELSDRIAAIAPVAGTLNVAPLRPAHPVSVVMFHGTDDQHVPFGGGRGEHTLTRGVSFGSVADSVAAWVKANGCDPMPVQETMPDATDDGMTVTRATYTNAGTGSAVVLYTITGGGRAWPGRPPRTQRVDQPTRDIDANAIIWDFFEQHPKAREPGDAD